VPVFATGAMWAVHALCVGKKPKAVFWCVLLPLCVVQIHYSGVALTAGVWVILAWLRPKIDWRFAAGGLAVALLTMIPYLKFQQAHDWSDFKQALNAVGGGHHWEQLHGVTTHPVTGYRLPSKQNFSYALAIMNAGRIEDVLGIAAAAEFDRAQVWGRTRRYFATSLTLGDWLLLAQRLAFVAALVWIAVEAARRKQWKSPTWILVLWFVLPLAVFFVTGLWTYLTYFAILYPVHFLVCGEAARRLKPGLTSAVVGVLVIANVVFTMDYYRFVGANGGAQGTFGTALGYKLQAARYLAAKGGEPLREQSETQLALSLARTREEQAALAQKLQRPILIELNHEGKPEFPQLEWPFLIAQQPVGQAVWPTNATVLLVDGNREALQPQQWQQLEQFPNTNFGPIKLFFVQR
jgi:hypothetical protein